MSKAMQITPDSQIKVVDNWQTDPENINNLISGYTLSLPQFWAHRKYRLSAFMIDTFEAKYAFNPIATRLYIKVTYANKPSEQVVFGFMIICNEGEEHEIDFTFEYYNYRLSKLDDATYRPRRHIFDWEWFLAKYEE